MICLYYNILCVFFSLKHYLISLLYTRCVVYLLMALLTTVQLFIDELLYVLVTIILSSLVAIVVTPNMMLSEFTLTIAAIILFVDVDLTINLM